METNEGKQKIKKKVTKNKSTKKSSSKKKIINKIPKIKIWLMEKGISQKDISEKTDLSTNTINRIVNTGKGSKSTLRVLALGIGISYDELLNLLVENESLSQK